jgi:hypothetical protein
MSWIITPQLRVFTWDAVADLGSSLGGSRTNPNGVWSYGKVSSLASTSLILSTVSTSTGWQSSGSGLPFFSYNSVSALISSHTPDDANTTAVIRWTSPFSGNISIDSLVTKTASTGDGVTFAVYKNSTPLFTGTAINGPSGASAYLGTTTVVLGDFIDFKVDRNSTVNSDSFRYSKILLAVTT